MTVTAQLCTLIAEQNELLYQQSKLLHCIAEKFCEYEIMLQIDNFEGTHSGRWLYARDMNSNPDAEALGLSVG